MSQITFFFVRFATVQVTRYFGINELELFINLDVDLRP